MLATIYFSDIFNSTQKVFLASIESGFKLSAFTNSFFFQILIGNYLKLAKTNFEVENRSLFNSVRKTLLNHISNGLCHRF